MSRTRAAHHCFSCLLPLCAAVLLLAGCSSSQPEDRQPNVIVIFIDDMGWTDLSSYGATNWATPEIDRLGTEGARFTDFYVPTPACSPSRAGLLTGRYPLKAGVREVLNPMSLRGMPESEVTAAEIFRDAGYSTAAIGKWHLGSHPDFLPTNHGFDTYFGLPYSNDMSRMSINNPRSFAANHPGIPLLRDTTIVEFEPDQRFLTEWYTQESIRFIEENEDTPFFLYLAHSMVHVPLWATDEFLGSSDGGLYGDVVQELDASTGRIMQRLDELGLDEHTIVVFTSDNGPWLALGEHSGTRGVLREGKATTFEGGVRIPGLIRAPGRVTPGQVVQEASSTLDILPTVLEMAGIDGPDNMDGRSLAGPLSGIGSFDAERPLFFYRSGQLRAMRKGDWKLHVPHRYISLEPDSGAARGRGGHPGSSVRLQIDLSLFNLADDIGETTDVKGDHPDVLDELLGHIEDARARIGDELRDRVGSEATPPQFIDAPWPSLVAGKKATGFDPWHRGYEEAEAAARKNE